ncbi:MAG: hypothetical protein DHS20C19_10340 [Acidimicrobiales bacterium]|nr:MAG: hypothetical protein DHS20C19_10340 [Acidimicrobiales bacterium]
MSALVRELIEHYRPSLGESVGLDRRGKREKAARRTLAVFLACASICSACGGTGDNALGDTGGDQSPAPDQMLTADEAFAPDLLELLTNGGLLGPAEGESVRGGPVATGPTGLVFGDSTDRSGLSLLNAEVIGETWTEEDGLYFPETEDMAAAPMYFTDGTEVAGWVVAAAGVWMSMVDVDGDGTTDFAFTNRPIAADLVAEPARFVYAHSSLGSDDLTHVLTQGWSAACPHASAATGWHVVQVDCDPAELATDDESASSSSDGSVVHLATRQGRNGADFSRSLGSASPRTAALFQQVGPARGVQCAFSAQELSQASGDARRKAEEIQEHAERLLVAIDDVKDFPAVKLADTVKKARTILIGAGWVFGEAGLIAFATGPAAVQLAATFVASFSGTLTLEEWYYEWQEARFGPAIPLLAESEQSAQLGRTLEARGAIGAAVESMAVGFLSREDARWGGGGGTQLSQCPIGLSAHQPFLARTDRTWFVAGSGAQDSIQFRPTAGSACPDMPCKSDATVQLGSQAFELEVAHLPTGGFGGASEGSGVTVPCVSDEYGITIDDFYEVEVGVVGELLLTDPKLVLFGGESGWPYANAGSITITITSTAINPGPVGREYNNSTVSIECDDERQQTRGGELLP